jgi:GNAT superfamily N-acetyltransferase
MFEIRSLTADDLQDAKRLSTQAGWNQIDADWERLLRLSPAGCFAGMADGKLVATTTVITHDDVSWIGMVLVDEAHRSQGYGSRIFERGLEYARKHGGDIIGLDATPLGEPIYRKYGFETVETVYRREGRLRRPDGTEATDRVTRHRRLVSAEVSRLCAFDRRQLGEDRGPLLRALLAESEVSVFSSRATSGIDGYAIARPGRTHWQIGPIISTTSEKLDALLTAVSDAFEGCAVIVDAPERIDDAMLESVGLTRNRELVRMTYPEAERALRPDSVRAFVDFAFG